jgi:hypothetical protein
MSLRTQILSRFSSDVPALQESPVLLLDLTLWHKWHAGRGSLPAGWNSVIEAAKALGTAAWAPFKPWRAEYDGVEVTTEETEEQRNIVYRAGGRTLLARWTRGPDGDWWQTEYPVKTPEDLQSAVQIAAARRYVLDAAGLDEWQTAVGDDGIAPLELPMRPYSDILHTMVGWGYGLTLLQGEGKHLVARILASLEGAAARLAEELVQLPGDLLLAPDNLDGQYISPRAFNEYLAPSYTATVDLARRCGRRLVVHLGGPGRRLIPLLAQSGVDSIEGIAGPPQSDADLAEAREVAGPGITLWGGIPQDLLVAEHDEAEFEAAVRQAVAHARADASGRSIVGVADRVPVGAELNRLRRLADRMG